MARWKKLNGGIHPVIDGRLEIEDWRSLNIRPS
jgi:hypothetical protein